MKKNTGESSEDRRAKDTSLDVTRMEKWREDELSFEEIWHILYEEAVEAGDVKGQEDLIAQKKRIELDETLRNGNIPVIPSQYTPEERILRELLSESNGDKN